FIPYPPLLALPPFPTRRSSDLNRDACHLADVRHGTAGSRVDLDHIHILLAEDDELDIDHTDDVQGFCKSSRVLRDLRLCALCQADRKSTRLNSSHVSISYAVFC